MEKLDLNKIYAEWLKPCGSCDAGLPMSCTCTEGDARQVIWQLVGHLDDIYNNHALLLCSTLDQAVDHVEEAERLLDDAWSVIANSPGWNPGTPAWVRLAEQWRDAWHEHMDKVRQIPQPERLDNGVS